MKKFLQVSLACLVIPISELASASSGAYLAGRQAISDHNFVTASKFQARSISADPENSKLLEGLMISLADVIDPTTLAGAIKFGATVTIVDEDTDEEKTWQIVGEHEANIEAGLLNIKSPIARALIGKDEGDSVEVKTPGGEKAYEILKVQYK